MRERRLLAADAAGLYGGAFYNDQAVGMVLAARWLLGLVHRHLRFRSVLDIGCGTGAWARAVHDLGARDTVGLDGACTYVPAEARILTPRPAHRP